MAEKNGVKQTGGRTDGRTTSALKSPPLTFIFCIFACVIVKRVRGSEGRVSKRVFLAEKLANRATSSGNIASHDITPRSELLLCRLLCTPIAGCEFGPYAGPHVFNLTWTSLMPSALCLQYVFLRSKRYHRRSFDPGGCTLLLPDRGCAIAAPSSCPKLRLEPSPPPPPLAQPLLP